MEKILSVLRLSPKGITIQGISKSHPEIPTHRINAALTALLAAKQALKEGSKEVGTDSSWLSHFDQISLGCKIQIGS
jgi:hypothetical protein